MRRGAIMILLLLSMSILTELALVTISTADASSTSDNVKVMYNVTVSEKTLVLFDNELVNGYHYNPNNYRWVLTSAVYDPVNGLVYATNSPNNTVVVFDPKNYSIVGYITVGNEPVSITINPANGYLYVVNRGSGTISVIDPSTNKVVNTIYVGNSPYMAVYNPSDGYLYVANNLGFGNWSIQLVNNQGVVKSMYFSFSANSMAYDPVSHYVIVGMLGGVYAISGDRIVAKNTNQYFENTYIGNSVQALAVNPTTGDIYGVTYRAVVVYNPYNLNMTGAVPVNLAGVTSSAVYANGTVYVVTLFSGILYSTYKVYAVNVAQNSSKLILSVTEVNTVVSQVNNVIANADGKLVLAFTTPTPFYVVNPQNGKAVGVGVNVDDSAVIYNPVTGYVYATNQYSNVLYVIDPSTGKVVNLLPSIPEPFAIAYNPKNGYLYVASYKSNTVAEVNPYTGQVIWSVVAGREPNAVLYNTHNDLLYVEYYGTSTVAVIDPNTGKILGEAQVGSEPVCMALDPSTGLVYVANEGSNSITVINGTQVVDTINLGFNPTALAFINGSLYIGGVTRGYLVYSSPHISVYKDGKIIANISLNAWPTGIQYYNGLVYVTTYGNPSNNPGYLAVINGTNVLKYVKVGISPSSIAMTPNGTIYVANEAEGTISEVIVSVKPLASTTTATSTTTAVSTSTATASSTLTTSTTPATTEATPTSVSSSSAPPTTSTSGMPISPGLLIVIVVVVIVIIIAVVFLLKR